MDPMDAMDKIRRVMAKVDTLRALKKMPLVRGQKLDRQKLADHRKTLENIHDDVHSRLRCSSAKLRFINSIERYADAGLEALAAADNKQDVPRHG